MNIQDMKGKRRIGRSKREEIIAGRRAYRMGNGVDWIGGGRLWYIEASGSSA